MDRSASGVLFNLFFAFHVVHNRRARSTLTFGGSTKRAVTYLEQGLRIAPKNMEMKLALAEAYREVGRRDEARKLLQEVLQMTVNPARAKENRETQERARKLLSK